jgi:uncharacterized damage-inducible protein DinB
MVSTSAKAGSPGTVEDFMRVACILVACAALSSSAAYAQTAAASKPVSGVWTGTLAPEGEAGAGATVTIELRVDGRSVSGVVSGPQLTPGDIRDGVYDPQRRSLTFSVVVRGEQRKIDFEGSIAGDSLIVRAPLDGRVAVIRAMRAGDLPTTGALTASPARDATLPALLGSFNQVSGWVTAAANAVPAEKYGYRPTESVRTVGQMLGHIIDGYHYYCGRATGNRVEWSDATEKGQTDKATLTTKLRQAVLVCESAYAGQNQIGPLVENVAHTNLHYGNLITYMRMLGLTPPSS